MGYATIAQAEAAIANMPGLSDAHRKAYQAEVNEARAAATRLGQQELDRITDEVRGGRDDLLRELCDVRDALAAATASGDRSVLADLRQRHQSLARQVEQIEAMVEQVEAIEADPVAYGESLFQKYPPTRPNFTFI